MPIRATNRIRRMILLGLVVVLAMATVPGGRGAAVNAATMSQATVTVTPNITGMNARYVISFTTLSQINPNDVFVVQFPAGTYVPCTPCHNQIAASSIRFNGMILPEDAMGNRDAAYISLKSPISVPANHPVAIEFTPDAQILNPQQPGASLVLSVESMTQADTVVSLPYGIENSKLTDAAVTIIPRTSNVPCSVAVSMTTGLKGALTTENPGLTITFPPTFTMPLFVSASMVTVNGIKPKNVFTNSSQVRVIPSQAVGALAPLTVTFSIDAGIRTPVSTGTVTFTMSSDAEPTAVKAVAAITEVPSIATVASTSPLVPDGQNGWFISPVVVVLSAVSNAPGTLLTYWSIDGSADQTYTSPFTIPDGRHTITYHSVNATMNMQEPSQTLVVNVESADPRISMDNFVDGGYVRVNPYHLTGSLVSLSKATLTIAGKTVYVDPSKHFDCELQLVEGRNSVSVDLATESGRTRHIDLSVVLDTVPPQFSIAEPSNFAVVHSSTVTVRGSVEKGATLTLAGSPVMVAEDGTFQSDVTCSKEGLNVFAFVAHDAAGNATARNLVVTYTQQQAVTTLVALRIGDKVANVNGKSVLIDAAPYIDKASGRTLVPLRFIGESLGAQVDWVADSETVTVVLGSSTIKLQVGNMQALVNGTGVTLDQPPVIVNARTFVPLRFISEALGATVTWDAPLQEIKVSLTHLE